ncbi:geranylgeranyl reductase family protein [Pyrococcus abyssi]|uniref:Flavoprotein monooxygenase, putative n=1 Tax=Pyrococcus abyssi (strain GE5 / Orsay) TaxID=272844 RepID=Q9UY96_PYRAB|nr:NAD(P)/FAD-dependent oxidoreductase [Pyrococcus abyssi]CAB50516.1 Flavoprotein monooxygenase, putative [Pyrococcus abyssi GE5]CCE71073.1 TPA: geranylgeranyl hydrogenase related [Pyrococcus abyssi GE5]
MNYDALIIGGGPVGNYLASLLAGKMSVAVVERKGAFGGKACTGIIGAENYESLGLPDKAILNAFKGAFFISKTKVFEIHRQVPQAYLVDRKVLERELAKRAIKRGADYYLATNFVGFKDGKAILQHLDSRFEIKAKYYVGADGVNSKVAQEIGAKTRGEVLRGWELEVLGNFRREWVEVWVNKDINPEFFFWVAPINEEEARIGTFGDVESLAKFLKVRRINPSNVLEIKSGAVVLGWRSPWVKDNVALVGDAALHIKPTTAGGIVFGSYCARALAKAILNGNLAEYEKNCSWVKEQVKFGLRIRKVFKSLTQKEIEEIFEVLGSEDARKLIIEKADFDDHVKTAKALLRNPRLLARLIRIAPIILRTLL